MTTRGPASAQIPASVPSPWCRLIPNTWLWVCIPPRGRPLISASSQTRCSHRSWTAFEKRPMAATRSAANRSSRRFLRLWGERWSRRGPAGLARKRGNRALTPIFLPPRSKIRPWPSWGTTRSRPTASSSSSTRFPIPGRSASCSSAWASRRSGAIATRTCCSTSRATSTSSSTPSRARSRRTFLVDRYPENDYGNTIYDVDFKPLPGFEAFWRGDAPGPAGAGLRYVDHLTHNVHRGRMKEWAEFYERLFGFREIRYFDIKGQLTGLKSKAMTSPCGKIRIPINESSDDRSQIQEYLEEYHGEGIQHIALHSGDIYATVDKLRGAGVQLLDTPDTYYEMVGKRLPNHGEPLAELQKRKILLDGSPGGGLLLQIFTKTAIGPIFFEIIQRKGDEGFGEGNFKALFESMELDQVSRGVLKPAA